MPLIITGLTPPLSLRAQLNGTLLERSPMPLLHIHHVTLLDSDGPEYICLHPTIYTLYYSDLFVSDQLCTLERQDYATSSFGSQCIA